MTNHLSFRVGKKQLACYIAMATWLLNLCQHIFRHLQSQNGVSM